MSKVENNRKIIETYYKSIASGDFETVMSLMHEDVVFNIVGKLLMLVSGKEEIIFMVF